MNRETAFEPGDADRGKGERILTGDNTDIARDCTRTECPYCGDLPSLSYGVSKEECLFCEEDLCIKLCWKREFTSNEEPVNQLEAMKKAEVLEALLGDSETGDGWAFLHGVAQTLEYIRSGDITSKDEDTAVDTEVAQRITENFLEAHKDDPIKKARDGVLKVAKELMYVIADPEQVNQRRDYTINALRDLADYLENHIEDTEFDKMSETAHGSNSASNSSNSSTS